MATLSLSLSAKINKTTRKSELMLRFVGGRDLVFRAKSGLFISADRWKEGKLIIPRVNTDEQKELINTQKRLNDLCGFIMESFLGTDRAVINKEWLNTIIDKFHYPEKYAISSQEVDSYFFDIFDRFLDERHLSEIRVRNFKVLYRALRRFEIYKNTDLKFDSISAETLRDFERFLKIEHTFFTTDDRDKVVCLPQYKVIYEKVPETRTPQKRGHNTLCAMLEMLRTFINYAVKEKITSNNPFLHFENKSERYGTPYYITIEERNIIYNTDLSKRTGLAIQRDIFVFQCLIGCRVSDLYKMSKNSVINGCVEYIPRKTKDDRPVTVRVPLNAIATEILERYSSTDNKSLLPFISTQKYNDAVKEVFSLAGITRNVTIINPTTGDEEQRPINEVASSHMARRCFVGNLYKQVKDPNLVGSLSGHTEGSRAFARYREIDDDMKIDLVNLLLK